MSWAQAYHSAACCSSGRGAVPDATDCRIAMMSCRTGGEEAGSVGDGADHGCCGDRGVGGTIGGALPNTKGLRHPVQTQDEISSPLPLS